MTRLHANNYSTTLNGGITAVATTITVNSVTGLPAIGSGDTCRLTLTDGTNVEIVQATAVTGFVITVVRAQEGTTGYAFLNGDTVELRATASDFVDLTSFTSNLYTTGDASFGTANTSPNINGSAVAPNALLSDDTRGIFQIQTSAVTAASGSVTYHARSRGTEAAKTVVVSGDYLGSIVAVGYDGTDYATSASIDFLVDGTPGADDMPGSILFRVAPDGSQTLATALTISNDKSATFVGSVDMSASATLKIPISAAPTITQNGHFAIDDTVTDFSHGVLKYYGDEEVGVVAMPIAQFSTPTNGYVVAYNSTNDEFELVAQSGGGAAALDDLTDVTIVTPLVGQTLIFDATAGVWDNAALTEGEGIDIANGDGSITISGEDATDANKGIASFSSSDFSVTSGAVSLLSSRNISTTGTIDFGGATSFELPNSATPTVNADGEVAIDTTVTDFSHGIMKYYSTEEVGVVAMPVAQFTTPTGGDIISYNATNDEFEMVTPTSFNTDDFDEAAGEITKREINFLARRTASQSIPTAVWTKVQLDGEAFDSDSYFDSTTNYRFTPGVAGDYLFYANVLLEALADTKLHGIAIYKNGAHFNRVMFRIGGTGNTDLNMATVVDLNGSTDYVELYVYHEHGSNRNISGGTPFYTQLGGVRLHK